MKELSTYEQNLTEKGRQIYYQLKPKLEKKFDPSSYVGIEVQSGDYFVGDNTIEALEKARKKYPRRKFFLAQIGRLAGLLK